MKKALKLLALTTALYWLGCDHQDQAPDNPFDLLRGRWEAVSGDLRLEDAVGKPYAYNWYVIDARPGAQPNVIWDNGRNCTMSEATAVGERLVFTIGEVLVTVESGEPGKATIHFRDEGAGKAFTKGLVRRSTSTELGCW